LAGRCLRAHKLANLVGVPLPLIGLIAAIVLLWNRAIGPLELGLLVGFYVITALGITLGYVRLGLPQQVELRQPERIRHRDRAGREAVQDRRPGVLELSDIRAPPRPTRSAPQRGDRRRTRGAPPPRCSDPEGRPSAARARGAASGA
jgi:hypothetical protein